MIRHPGFVLSEQMQPHDSSERRTDTQNSGG